MPALKRKTSATPLKAASKRQRTGHLFWQYVQEVNNKHSGAPASRLDEIVASHGFPPTDLREELNVKFAQRTLLPMAGGNPAWQLLLVGLFQAPDHCWCLRSILDPLLKGIVAQRAGRAKEEKRAFDKVEKILEKRAEASGVFGTGDSGVYNAEHLTATMKGKTHVQALRLKLQWWPKWLEDAVLPLVKSWPASSDTKGIDKFLRLKYPKALPEGVHTTLRISSTPGLPREKKILDLFGGDVKKATSALSQAFLFAEMLRPSDPEQRKLRKKFGWGAGPFVVRGFWMDFQKSPLMAKSLPQFDTESFCPGFTGALAGAADCQLEQATGISLNPGNKSAPNWTSWQVQVRFTAWLHS
jgi:hypothetical protein